MMPEAANMEEILAQEAVKKYGRSIEELTPDELNALYRDYEGERKVQEANYAQGQGLIDNTDVKGIQAGNVYASSGYGNVAASLLKQYAGYKNQKEAKDKLAEMSADYAKGSRAGGDVAAYQNDAALQAQERMMNALIKNRAMSNTATQQQQTPPPPAPAPQGGPPQGAPPEAPTQTANGNMVPPQRPISGMEGGPPISTTGMTNPMMKPGAGGKESLMAALLRKKREMLGT